MKKYKLQTPETVSLRLSALLLIILTGALFSPLALSIGRKIVLNFPNTPLANAKPWHIDSYGDDWAFFATEDGLIEYDNSSARLFPLHNRYAMRSVNMDRERGRLYVGGINEFGYFVPSAQKSLEYICLSDSVGEDRHVGNVWSIYPSGRMVYVQGDHSILIYDEKLNSHTLLGTSSKLDCSALIDDVLWLGTDDGLKFLMGKTLADASGASELKGKRIRSILPFGNAILIVTAESGVYRYDRNSLTRLDAASRAATEFGDIFCADIFGNSLALGSISNGVAITDLTSGQTMLYNESAGLTNNTVLSIHFDENGDLWAGADVGLSKIQLTLPVEAITNSAYPFGSGYVLATEGGKMYLGTNRGVFCVDYFPGAELYRASFRQLPGTRGQVWGLPKVGDDLFCCSDRGLFLIKGETAVRVGELSGIWDVQPFRNDPSMAYVGTYSGLYVMSKESGSWVVKGKIKGYAGSCYNFVQQSPSTIWSDDGEGGMLRISLDKTGMNAARVDSFDKTSDGVPLTSDIHISLIDGKVYFSTPAGLYRNDAKTDAIVPDPDMSMLIGSPRNLLRVKKTGGWIYALTDKEVIQADPAGILGMRRIPVPVNESRTMKDGDVLFSLGSDHLAFPVRNGYLFFDFSDSMAGAADTVRKIPMSRINRLAVTVDKDSTVYRDNFMGIKDKIVLPYSENSIRIEFGREFEQRQGVVYCTRFSGDKWSKPVSSTMKEFTNLKEGSYTFEVRAVAPDGSESVDSISFRVLPPWWRSPLAIAVYVALSMAAIVLCVALERRRVSRKQEALAKEKDAQIMRQQEDFEMESKIKDHKIVELEKEKLDKELRHKAQEMATLMMSLAHKNEMLQDVRQELQEISSLLPKTSAEARNAIRELQGKVAVDIKNDQILKRVEEEFDLVHNGFMKNLRSRFPDLTNNEVLMCAYIKMNLSTKEIAPLLNISVRGVETMRYRLRKKFGLGREESLTQFLSGD